PSKSTWLYLHKINFNSTIIMKNISVIGAGTMGNGIAHTFAQSGYKVSLIDRSNETLDSALNTIEKNLNRQVKKGKISEADKKTILANISTFTQIKTAVSQADLIVEAATENTEVKLGIFKEIDPIAPKEAILASNTSSISITKIAAATNRPEQV